MKTSAFARSLLLLLLSLAGYFCGRQADKRCPQCDTVCCMLDYSLYKQLHVVVNCTEPDRAFVIDKETTTEKESQTDAEENDNDQCNETSLAHANSCLTALPVNICDFRASLRALSLPGNHLSSFPNLTCLHRLLVLDLSHNVLTHVPAGAFDGLTLLREMYIDGNLITYIHPDIFDPALNNLRVFSASHNLLTTINPWLFLLPYEFCVFDFSFNGLVNGTNEHHRFINMSFDKYGPGIVDFSYNSFISSPLKEFEIFGVWNMSQMIIFVDWAFDFRHNPFQCDCKLYDFISMFKFLAAFGWQDYLNVTCFSPPRLRDVPFRKVSLNQLTCDVMDRCPPTCKCTQRPYYEDMLVNCTHGGLTTLPQDLPEGNLALLMTGNAVRCLDKRNYLGRVAHLDLTGNHLQEVDPQAGLLLRNVKLLDLRGNDLRHVPRTLQAISPGALYLDDNTLQCSCDLDWFPEWVRHGGSDSILKVECLSADGHHILLVNATRHDLGCDAEMTSTSASTWVYVFLVAALIVTLPIVGVVFRHELLVLKHRLVSSQPRDKQFPSLLDTLRYDVFISIANDSDHDAAWVRTVLLPAMERRRLTYFLPHRDYLPGAIPTDEIVQTLRQSKCVLVVVSPDYLANPSCRFQFRQAYNLMAKEGRGRVFVVRVQKVKRRQVEDRMLRAMLTLDMAYAGCRPEHVQAVLDRIHAHTR